VAAHIETQQYTPAYLLCTQLNSNLKYESDLFRTAMQPGQKGQMNQHETKPHYNNRHAGKRLHTY
jgi:hypothetical protein